MINIFKTEDFDKYPELRIAIMGLVKEWLDTHTELEMKKNDKSIIASRKTYRTLYKKLSMRKIVDRLVEQNMRNFLSELLIENIYYHLIKHGDPKRYSEIIEIVKSGDELKIKKGFNLTSLLGIYLTITKNRIDDSIRKQRLHRSPAGEIDLFKETQRILDEKKNYRFTKKEALIVADKKLNVFGEDKMSDKLFLKKLDNRYRQFEQREANKKIKKVNRITKG